MTVEYRIQIRSHDVFRELTPADWDDVPGVLLHIHAARRRQVPVMPAFAGQKGVV